ncbi:MAG: translation initiation factor IF-3 [Planctomycetes bacterium]|nr:translation initiation factor IF-3 [Planctomycetota bacterium]
MISKQNLRVNERIRTSPIRLIDENNNQVGLVDVKDAQFKAHNLGLDLVEVSPNAEPPVCRIMDYGKHLYEQKRKTKLSQKKQHVVSLKEIRLRPKIDDHDRDIKINRAAKFLDKGHKVQFTMLFRGREMMHVDRGREIMNEVTETLAEKSKVERRPVMLGRRMTMVVSPEKQQ